MTVQEALLQLSEAVRGLREVIRQEPPGPERSHDQMKLARLEDEIARLLRRV